MKAVAVDSKVARTANFMVGLMMSESEKHRTYCFDVREILKKIQHCAKR